MRNSQDRIITTHVGSLVRPDRLESLLVEREHGTPIDKAEFDREIDSALDYVIGRQIDSGVDVGSDGEMPRVSFMTYVPQRMSGYSGVSIRNMPMDMIRFPKYAKMFADRTWSDDRKRPKVWNAPMATGKIKYEDDLKDVRFEMTAFKKALDRRSQQTRLPRDVRDRGHTGHCLDCYASGPEQSGLSDRPGICARSRARVEEGVRLHRIARACTAA